MEQLMTRADLIEWIKRQLGYPTRNVELNNDQLEDAVNFALHEVQPWYTSYHYLTIDVTSKVINLEGYNVYDVSDVIKIPRGSLNSSSALDDPFSYGGYYGGMFPMGAYGGVGTTASTYYISRLTNSDIHHVVSAYTQQYQELFYTKLAYILAQRTNGLLRPSMNFEYDRPTKLLYIDPGYPQVDLVTIEYIPYLYNPEVVTDNRYIRIIQDLALGQALSTLSRVVGKYTISNSPSTINYQDYRTDSEALISRAREELKNITVNWYITD